ncbi:hypothetical protein [uncultured Stenotrophomonas sp.]|uniref:hypothetical protein n=1 Tax=uncultured Stenotrophomonas sp. TaxID=165438 RepID=UPI0025D8E103|nr:hypothetical protein [uncultured Stenotrophomonas sp.]
MKIELSSDLHRSGAVLKGEPESWSGKDLRFETRGDAHAVFLCHPSVDGLARVSARHASSSEKKATEGIESFVPQTTQSPPSPFHQSPNRAVLRTAPLSALVASRA